LFDSIRTTLTSLTDDEHSHANKSELDTITQTLLDNINNVLLMLTGITSVAGTVADSPNAIPTCRAIVNYVSMLGGGDMMKSTYDQDNDGVVDDSEKLGGQLPSYYQTATDNTLTTTDKTVAGAINEVVSTIGDLDDLTTSDKDSVVDAINDARGNAIECVGGSTIETIGNGAIGSYAVDDLFVADDGYVYKATAIIAPTNTLTVGSNCSKTNIKAELNTVNTAMANKVNKFTGGGYVPVDSLAYDSTNKKLGLKVNGADTVIPFSSGGARCVMSGSMTSHPQTYYTGFFMAYNFETGDVKSYKSTQITGMATDGDCYEMTMPDTYQYQIKCLRNATFYNFSSQTVITKLAGETYSTGTIYNSGFVAFFE
jgi:hypothetical protein